MRLSPVNLDLSWTLLHLVVSNLVRQSARYLDSVVIVLDELVQKVFVAVVQFGEGEEPLVEADLL